MLLVLSLFCFGSLVWIIYSFPPDVNLIQSPIAVPILLPAFLLLFLGITAFITFLFKNLRRGILVALFPTIYLLLKLNHLDSPILNLVLLGILLAIEFFFVSRK